MRVIGAEGGREKCDYAVGELGYDICLDHHLADAKTLTAQVGHAAPAGVDVYYENVGGKTLEAVIPNMNTDGRIALCGMLAWYSGEGTKGAMILPALWGAILRQRLKVQGLIVFDHYDHFSDFLSEVGPLVHDGQIKYSETISDGLENTPDTFLKLLQGQNFGKQLVRVGADPS